MCTKPRICYGFTSLKMAFSNQYHSLIDTRQCIYKFRCSVVCNMEQTFIFINTSHKSYCLEKYHLGEFDLHFYHFLNPILAFYY